MFSSYYLQDEGCEPVWPASSPVVLHVAFSSNIAHNYGLVPRPPLFFVLSVCIQYKQESGKKMGKAWEHLSSDLGMKWTWEEGGAYANNKLVYNKP